MALIVLGTVAVYLSAPATAVDCIQSKANADLLTKVPEFSVKIVDPNTAGPGSADTADLCNVVAAEYKPASSTVGDDYYTALKAFAGTAKSGDGAAFVDAFLSDLGPDARNGTVEMDGRTVAAFVTPSGDGLAYSAGPSVVIGYVVASDSIAMGLDPAATQEPAKGAFTRLISRVDGMPLSDAFYPGTGPGSYPLGRGRYTTPDDPGWVYFRTTDAKGAVPVRCGIAPGGALAGCDLIPSDVSTSAGANQTVVDDSGPAHYIHSDTTTFSRDVDELRPGHRIVNGPALCWLGYQGVVHCQVGEHAFWLSHQGATLE